MKILTKSIQGDDGNNIVLRYKIIIHSIFILFNQSHPQYLTFGWNKKKRKKEGLFNKNDEFVVITFYRFSYIWEWRLFRHWCL